MAFPIIPAIMALAQYVPAITRWVSGENAGPIAETIASVATTVTGSTTIAEAIQRIQSEPDKQRAFQLAMQDKGDDIEKAYLEDRQSARERDTRIQVATGRNRRGDILAGLAVIAFIAVFGLIFFGPPIERGERDLLMIMAGALIGLVKDVYGFEFGSSKDSARGINAVASYIANGKNRP